MTAPALPPVVAKVSAAFAALGSTGEPQLRTSVESSIGSDPSQSFATSHLFRVGSSSCLVLTRPDRSVDAMALKGVLGQEAVSPIDPETAVSITGQVPTAIAPVATKEPLSVILDIDLARFTRLWIPAGDPAWVFPTNYAQLLSITAGIAAEVGELPLRSVKPTLPT